MRDIDISCCTRRCKLVTCIRVTKLNMSNNETQVEVDSAEQQPELRAKQAPRPLKKLRPARKQVKPGDVVKTETVQTGKEYSTCCKSSLHVFRLTTAVDIWYNKWAGGDREDNYSKCAASSHLSYLGLTPALQ